MSINCDIKLSTDAKFYYPRQAVSGVVDLNIFDDYLVKGFNIKLIGYVTGPLCLSSDGAKEYFLVLKISILNQPTVLRPGIQNYRFKFLLPDDTPPTIISAPSKISYKIRATFERPWDHDIIYQKYLNIGTAFNINLLSSSYIQPVTCTHTIKYFNLLKWNTNVEIKLHVPKSVFAVDDVIPISVEVNNSSETSVYFVFTLEEDILYGGTTLIKSDTRKLTKVKSVRAEGHSELVARGSQENFIHNLRVPFVAGTNIESSKIFIGYNLVVTLMGKGLHFDRSFQVPISIFNKQC